MEEKNNTILNVLPRVIKTLEEIQSADKNVAVSKVEVTNGTGSPRVSVDLIFFQHDLKDNAFANALWEGSSLSELGKKNPGDARAAID